MTREKAVKEMLFCSWHVRAHRDSMIADRVHSLYDEFEAIIKTKDNEITALKAQQTALYDILKSLQKQHLYDVLNRANQ